MLERKVKCPQCHKEIVYSLENKFRPFCSERCKIIDLGDWASESFRIPVKNDHDFSLHENQDDQGIPDDDENL